MLRKLFSVILALVVVAIIISTISLEKHEVHLPQTNPISSRYNRQSNTSSVPNVPDIYFKTAHPVINYNQCPQFPEFLDLKFSSDYWQTQAVSSGTFQLFNAYLDDREYNQSTSWPRKYFIIRIVGMLDVVETAQKFYCQVWYNSTDVIEVQTDKLLWVWVKNWINAKNIYQPYLISCPLPDERVPISVSLVEKKCDVATNNLKVFYETAQEKKDFVVCVKGLNFPFQDISTRLVEWIELLKILGADKVHFYNFHVHPNVWEVLKYYLKRKRIEVTPLTLVGAPNDPQLQSQYLKDQIASRRLQEVLVYNDCFYKYLHQYKYVVLLDTDEVVVPAAGNWTGLMDTLQTQKPNGASYVAKDVYFFDNFVDETIPKIYHMLRHVRRAKEYNPGEHRKGFHDTRNVLALYNHVALFCFGEGCDIVDIGTDLAHVQHYRGDCVKELSNCDSLKNVTVVDDRIWNYGKELSQKVLKALGDLGSLDDY